MTPAAGPDSSMRMHWRLRLVEIEQAAVRLHDQERAVEALRLRDAASSLAEIGADARPDIGIGGDGRSRARTRDIPARARARP